MLLHKSTTDLAVLLLRFVPRCIVTVRIAVTAEECPSAPALALDNLAAAFRTGNTCVAQERLRVAAVGKTRAREELAEASLLDDHHAPAFIAGNIRNLVGNLDGADDFLCIFECFLEGRVEFAKQVVLVECTVCHLVQFALEICRELHVHNVLKILLKHIGHDEAEFRRAELLFSTLHIAAFLDGLDDGGIGARTSDAHFLQCLDNGGIVVARRRFGKMLLRFQFRKRKHIPRLQLRQQGILFLFCNLRTYIDGGVALELELGAVCTQLVVSRRNLCRNRIVDGCGHLARRKTLPDQRVETQLVTVQILLHIRRCPHNARRADRLMRVLRLFAHRIDIGTRRNVFLAVFLCEIAPCLVDGEIGNAR